jgi:hypothetical protein
MRTFGIWAFGILASAIVGGIVGSRFDEYYSGGLNMILGVLAGVFTFACIRLWLGQWREASD